MLISPPLFSEPTELQRCVFPDSLVTVSESGRDLGKFSVTVEFARRVQRPCMLLHAQSQGAIDDSPCGTTVTGEERRVLHALHFQICLCFHILCFVLVYLTSDLEVLEEEYHEYVKVSYFSISTNTHTSVSISGIPSYATCHMPYV